MANVIYAKPGGMTTYEILAALEKRSKLNELSRKNAYI